MPGTRRTRRAKLAAYQSLIDHDPREQRLCRRQGRDHSAEQQRQAQRAELRPQMRPQQPADAVRAYLPWMTRSVDSVWSLQPGSFKIAFFSRLGRVVESDIAVRAAEIDFAAVGRHIHRIEGVIQRHALLQPMARRRPRSSGWCRRRRRASCRGSARWRRSRPTAARNPRRTSRPTSNSTTSAPSWAHCRRPSSVQSRRGW